MIRWNLGFLSSSCLAQSFPLRDRKTFMLRLCNLKEEQENETLFSVLDAWVCNMSPFLFQLFTMVGFPLSSFKLLSNLA